MQEFYLKAIVTKYLPHTIHLPSRIKASDKDGNMIMISFDSDAPDGGHRRAAEMLRDKMGWKGNLIGGHIKDGMVFVFSGE